MPLTVINLGPKVEVDAVKFLLRITATESTSQKLWHFKFGK